MACVATLSSLIDPYLGQFEEDVRRRYSSETYLQHYHRLATRLYKRIPDDDLHEAALLHGIRPADLRAASVPASPVALGILDDFQYLLGLKGDDSSRPPRLDMVMSKVMNARALLLFVFDQLVRLDPDDLLGAWTRSFPIRPTALPKSFEDRAEGATPKQIAFLREALAPLAAQWGLWQERNIAENAAFYHEDPRQFERVLDFVMERAGENGAVAAHVNSIAEEINKWGMATIVSGESGRAIEPGQVSIRWEWRHIASIAAHISGARPDEWRKKLHRTGFVTLTCASEDECYRLLGQLHRQIDHRPTEIRDLTRRRELSGYRAIHTILVLLDKKDEDLVAVRLIPQSAANQRFEPAGPEILAALSERVNTMVRVYTPSGDHKDLPVGATVLNFAHAVHADFVARVRHAIINKHQRVDILHRLSPGDEVQLVLDKPRSLPSGWENGVPTSTRSRLRAAERRALQPGLLSTGRKWLRERLEVLGQKGEVDDETLDLLLEDSSIILAQNQQSKSQPASFWLQQIGRNASQEAEERMPSVVKKQVETLVDNIVERLRSLCSLASDPDIPLSMRGGLQRVVYCSCAPDRQGAITATFQDGVLTIHRADAACGRGGVPLHRWRRVVLRKFFVVETTNRPGVAAEVLAVFRHAGVDVAEVVGRRLGRDWGVIRVQADGVGLEKTEWIRRNIMKIDGIARFIEAQEHVEGLEDSLPPRQPAGAEPWRGSRPEPYHCADHLDDERHFYGRRDELERLHAKLLATSRSDATSGASVFICGAFKIGKTSLIKQFFRELNSGNTRGPCLTVYHRALTDDAWDDVARELGHKLCTELERATKHWQLSVRVPERADFFDVLAALPERPRRPPIVAVVDEAVGLFRGLDDRQDREQIKKVERLRTLISRTPGLFVVWIGPSAPVRTLNQPFTGLLGAAQPLKLGALRREATGGLLAAEKFRPMHDIRISPGLVDKIHHLTGGNPFWIHHLGNMMWSQYHRAGEEMRYSDEMLEWATSEIIADPLAFRHITGDEKNKTRWNLLRRLASSRSERGLQRSHLSRGCARAQELLEEFEELGAVRKELGNRWRIAAPLLRDYILIRPAEAP